MTHNSIFLFPLLISSFVFLPSLLLSILSTIGFLPIVSPLIHQKLNSSSLVPSSVSSSPLFPSLFAPPFFLQLLTVETLVSCSTVIYLSTSISLPFALLLSINPSNTEFLLIGTPQQRLKFTSLSIAFIPPFFLQLLTVETLVSCSTVIYPLTSTSLPFALLPSITFTNFVKSALSLIALPQFFLPMLSFPLNSTTANLFSLFHSLFIPFPLDSSLSKTLLPV